jgi:hypothetical protein
MIGKLTKILEVQKSIMYGWSYAMGKYDLENEDPKFFLDLAHSL